MRRILLIGLMFIGVGTLMLSRHTSDAPAQVVSPSNQTAATSPSGYDLQWDEGDKMILGRRRAPLNIKVSPKTGSQHLIMGTEQIAGGTAIPVHMHEHEDEIIFVHKGGGTVVVGDKTFPANEGATVFVPKGTWHGVQNQGSTKPLEMLWIFSQPGMDDFFRELSVPVGAEPRQLTPKEIEDADHKHGMRRKVP